VVKKKGSRRSASVQTHQTVNSTKAKRAPETKLDDLPVKPLTPQEHRVLDHLIERCDKRLRRRYSEVHGKVVDWVTHSIQDGHLHINVRFKDKTEFCLRFFSKIAVGRIELCDIKTGDFRLIREYPRLEQAR
jgi:hypothetical protein